MKRWVILLVWLGTQASAETLNLTSNCENNICTTGSTVMEVEITAANAGRKFQLTGTAQPTITFTPAAAGKWNVTVKLDLGRNDLSVKTVDGSGADLGDVGTAVVYYQLDDARANLVATGFFGVSLDSFAASDLNKYINPDQNSKIKERGVGGITFGYRLVGDPKKDKTGANWVKRSQLWIYGEAIHGVRSAGVDCTEDQAATETTTRGVCVSFDPSKPNRTLYMIRASTSLEAFMGARWEMFSLQPLTGAPAAFYVKGQAGFLTVAGSGGDLIDVHHIAAGAVAKAGMFTGSYLEMGLGKTALFPKGDAFPRMKVNAYLQWPLFGQWLQKHGMTGFAQMTVDSNPQKGGADSVQSYFGINFDLRTLF